MAEDGKKQVISYLQSRIKEQVPLAGQLSYSTYIVQDPNQGVNPLSPPQACTQAISPVILYTVRLINYHYLSQLEVRMNPIWNKRKGGKIFPTCLTKTG